MAGCLAKNQNKLSADALDLTALASLPLLRTLFLLVEGEGGGSKGKHSVVHSFRAQLGHLVQLLQACSRSALPPV